MFLRQSTASQEVILGTFVDETDGKTAETGLTIANTDIKLHKHGAAAQANKNSGGATHDAGGRYVATLDATDTDTLGNLEINVHVAGALPVRREFVVLAAAVYDVLLGTTAISTHTAADVWAVGTRVLTAGTNIVLAKGTGVTGFNDLSTAQVNTEVDTALSDWGKTGFSLASTGLDAVVVSEPAGEAQFGTTTMVGALGCLLVPITNKKTFNKSTGVATYRNNADNASLWTTTATDDGTTRTIGKAT